MKKLLFSISSLVFMSSFAQTARDAQGHPCNSECASEERQGMPVVFTAKAPVVVHTIPGPSGSLDDIAFDGQNLWVAGYGVNLLYKVSRVNGATLKTIPTTVLKPYGLEFFNGNLWVMDNSTNTIQKVDTANGNVLANYPGPAINGTYPTGLAWDGTRLWSNDPKSGSGGSFDTTFTMNASCQVLQRHHSYGTYVSGLAWDGNYLWSADNPSGYIYKIDASTFNAIDTVSTPAAFPNGLAWDGQHLWVASNGTNTIYELDISNTTGTTELLETKCSLFPNPSFDQLTVRIDANNIGAAFMIFDAQGKKLLLGNLKAESTSIDISLLPAGFYSCVVSGKSCSAVKFQVAK